MTDKAYRPLVSIITPVFNGRNLIEKCFDSIVKQNYDNLEWVIVDDGSTDNLNEIVQVLKSRRLIEITYVKQKNKGACSARKTAIHTAKASYIVNVDCDDYLSGDAVSNAMNIMLKDQTIDFVLFSLVFIDSNADKQKPFICSVNEWPINGEIALSNCIDNWKVHGLGLIKKDVYLKAYQLLGEEKDNNINTDELLTRYLFHYSRMVDISSGIYFYVSNMNSTTMSVNNNSYKVVYNAIILNDFIVNNYPQLKSDSQNHLLATGWEVSFKLFKNYKVITNRSDWLNSIWLVKRAINYKYLEPNKGGVSKIKFYIKIIVVKIVGSLGKAYFEK